MGITLLEYVDKKLVHWSDNSFDVPLIHDDSLFAKPLVFIQNGWFITKQSSQAMKCLLLYSESERIMVLRTIL